MAALRRNGWPESIGISGRFRPESVAGFVRNTHFSQGGAYLEVARPITPGATVLIRFLQCEDFIHEHPEDLRFNAIAEVKWCRELSSSEKFCYGAGVRYHFPA